MVKKWIKWLKKPYRVAAVYTVCLIALTAFVLVDTFVLPHGMVKVSTNEEPSEGTAVSVSAVTTEVNGSEPSSDNDESSSDSSEPSSDSSETNASSETTEVAGLTSSQSTDLPLEISEFSYADENIQIQIDEVSENGVVYYVADVVISDAKYLKTALAEDTYGKNVTAPTSEIASAHDAIFAINGDYYGFRDEGYVLRNGQLLRSTVNGTETEALVIDSSGNLSLVYEREVSAETLENQGAWQVLSFGPALIVDGETVSRSTQNGSRDNPRTAIGQVAPGHYVFVVVDGRTALSEGVTLDELAEIMLKYGCETAYNLDGGGTATMWFNGQVINNPTDGKKSGERAVSDIVYIGY